MRVWRVERGVCVVTLAVTLLLLSGTQAPGRQATASQCLALPADARVEREVAGEGQACYEVSLKPGELFRVRVWQKDSEILLRLLGAGGAELARMSSPREWEGLETLSFVATEARSYRLEAGLLDKQVGKGAFTILREPARAATAADRMRVVIERLFAEGMVARDGTGTAETAIKKFSAAAAGWRELGDEYMTRLSDLLVTRSRARAMFIEGRNLLKKTPPEPGRANYGVASVKFQEARRLFNEGGQSINEGASLLGAALAEQALDHTAESINFVEQSLPIFSGDKGVKVDLLNNLVTFYLILNDTDSAIRSSREAHAIYVEDLKQPDYAAAVANNLGVLYLEIGENKEAFKYLNESLQQREKSGDRCGLPATLSSLGVYYYAIGEKARAKEFLLDKALPKYPAGYECSIDKAQTLISIGKFYYDLGANDLALEYLGRADALVKINLEAVKALNHDDFGAKAEIATLRAKTMLDGAMMLNYMGAANFASAREREAAISLTRLSPRRAAEARAQARKQYNKARSSYEEALKLYREISDKRHEATVMTNIGVVLAASGRTAEAMAIFDKALTVGRGSEDKDAEGITLSNIGEVYSAWGQHRRALEYFDSALPLLKAVNDKGGEAITLTDSMNAWNRAGNRRMAIFCGKQAINIFQDLRSSARGLNTEIQKDYLRRVRSSYQRLAELLVAEGLYAQAVQTLNLYQDQQFFDLDRGASVEQAAFTDRERDRSGRYDAAGSTLARLRTQIDEVKRQIGYRPPTAEKKAELENLKAEFARAMGAFAGVVEGAEKGFARPPEEKDKVADVTPVTKMQRALDSVEKAAQGKGLRQKAFALYTFIGAERFYVFLLKPGAVEAYMHPTGSAELNKLALDAQYDLQNPGFPKKILGSSSKLYNVILKAASTRDGKSLLEGELERESPDVLLWSLDGALSYLPVAALFDARRSQYLVERYQNVVFTRADADRITRPPVEWANAVGFGKSTPTEATCEVPCDKPHCDPKLKPLSHVPQEMATIFTGTPGEPALLKGEVVLDGKFTREAMVKGNHPQLVHVASHFCFRPGDAEGSFLLLGDEKKFSLSQMSAYPGLYAGVDLLVLSACQTAALEPNQMGKEVDSLAELSQRLGAASVLATLWKADDIGASQLMIKFYALHRLHKEWSKAELLRRAQLDLLKGVETAPDANLDHPFYWAPFVLYGSFR
ncbi:MAG: hypothetical protein QOH49_3565 [Acidobacteriota bacterium]|jgi:CHAT domain-containing protein/Tfp pilus assembly protein PilF|nr:hypothetical protein [Acidobacteriota bacterium]